ncbi:MAG: tripartite tricarboxylate transporter TctB family protein [Meiothermus sp.]|uniref:tripartite tricarboxylate transporter TctB family protein n=1 Tax=Meiothermus sp. TaxID=1955249 RepID=UPI0025E9A4C2|nr:tripartite tricarboxylate transporter TctB family protein [Meiothermus sp.]MCS7067118.1 tripartite tricarboxylate transporter TctB family protein [Meiothermus sp.]MCX7601477.1 tripartite tricarboxylate transporter TctB family protein [Meiothermus sp.]
MPAERFWERAVALVALALGMLALYLSRSLPQMEGGYPGPALFPSILGVVLVASGLGLLWQERGSKGGLEGGEGRVLLVILGLALAPWLLGQIKLAPTAGLYALAGALLLGVRPAGALLTGGAVALLVYLVFQRFLGVQG